jgi:hypothetical protein
MDSNVGTHKLFENDDIIMWEFLLEPGETTSCHTHVHDYVFHVLEGSRLEVFAEDGELLAAFDAPTGGVFPLRMEGDKLVSPLGGPPAPATHSARNAGTARYRELLVETKRR